MKMITSIHRVLLAVFALSASIFDVQAQQVIHPPKPPHNSFGEVLAGHGRELAVRIGARVEIYRRYDDGWRPAQLLTIQPGVTQIAYEMAMSHTWLAMASRTPGFGDATNYIDMYRRDTQGWTFVQRLDSPRDINGNGYVRTLALSDTTLLMGHHYKTPYTYPRVFVFDRQGEGWSTPYELAPPPGSSRVFGAEFSVSDEILAASDPERSGTGAIVAFTRDGTNWVEAGVMGSPNPTDGRTLGRYVATCGRAVVAHTDAYGALPPFDRSSVLIFTGGPHAWRLSAELLAPDDANDTFGDQMVCNETTLVIPYGAPWSHQTYATSLHAPSLKMLEVTATPLPTGSLCQQAVVSRGDIACSSSIRWHVPPSEPRRSRVIYAFNNAIDALFVHGFE